MVIKIPVKLSVFEESSSPSYVEINTEEYVSNAIYDIMPFVKVSSSPLPTLLKERFEIKFFNRGSLGIFNVDLDLSNIPYDNTGVFLEQFALHICDMITEELKGQ